MCRSIYKIRVYTQNPRKRLGCECNRDVVTPIEKIAYHLAARGYFLVADHPRTWLPCGHHGVNRVAELMFQVCGLKSQMQSLVVGRWQPDQLLHSVKLTIITELKLGFLTRALRLRLPIPELLARSAACPCPERSVVSSDSLVFCGAANS